jgi:glutathione S-transferase
MLKLFYSPNSCSLASHIALEQSGAEYEAIRLNFAESEQRQADYLAINPKGRVPALVTDKGVLTENPAILMYISLSYPGAHLVPENDVYTLARIQSFNAYLSSTVHVAHAHGHRGYRWADDEAAIAEMSRKMPQTMGECFELIETEMIKGPWVMGDEYSCADIYLFTIAQWLEADRVDIGRFPRVADHRTRMRDLPVVQKVLAEQ